MPLFTHSISIKALCTGAVLVLLQACTSMRPDQGIAGVQQLTQDSLKHRITWANSDEARAAIDQQVKALLAKPLTADSAVQLTLLNNPGLQARLADVGIAQADWVQAGRWPNPGFSLGRFHQGEETTLEFGLHLNLLRLLNLPILKEQSARRLHETQRDVALYAIDLSAQAMKAFVEAVAAQQKVSYRHQVMQAAQASAELARRMAQAGNFSKLQQAREQRFYAEAVQGLAQAKRSAFSSRERLIRVLGLWADQARFELPERLADLPAAVPDRPQVEQQAMTKRIDVQGAQLATVQAARDLGLTPVDTVLGSLELGLAHSRPNDGPSENGFEIGFELPLFDSGDARAAKRQARYLRVRHLAAQTAINARSEVREAYMNFRSAYDIARHQRDEILPLAQTIADENLLRYNGMLIGVFELLSDARSHIETVSSSIDTLKDFWLAQADLDLALVGKPSLASPGAADNAPGSDAGAGGH